MNGGTLSTNASNANYFNGISLAYAGSNGAEFQHPRGQSVTVSQSFQDLSGQKTGTLLVLGNGALNLTGSNAYTARRPSTAETWC